jgi:chemotaxis protein histidine kinase CheA
LTGIPQGDQIVVEVKDDGSGIDLKQIAAKAVAAGLLDPGKTIGWNRLWS